MKLLRYNNWTKDPLADGNPGNQISSRFDLVPPSPPPPNPYLARAAFGGTDSKVTSSQLIAQGRVFAQRYCFSSLQGKKDYQLYLMSLLVVPHMILLHPLIGGWAIGEWCMKECPMYGTLGGLICPQAGMYP